MKPFKELQNRFWFSSKEIASTIIMNHRSKVSLSGRVLLLCLVFTSVWWLSSMVVVSIGCQLLRFDIKLMMWTVNQTLSWWETLLRTCPWRHQVWHVYIPELFCLRHPRGSALWHCLWTWAIHSMLVPKIVIKQAMFLHRMRFT